MALSMYTRNRHQVLTSAPSHPSAAEATVPSRISSLLFMMDLEEDNGRRGTDGRANDELAEELHKFLTPANEHEQGLTNDVKGIVSRLAEHPSGILMDCVAEELLARGYAVRLHTSVGGGDGSDCLHNLRHSFLTVTFPGCSDLQATNHPARRQYIVDPNFKEQFQIAKSTPRYTTITAVLPTFYVGLEEQLPPLVSFLVSELAASFAALDCILPPWRHLDSMLSKWKPRRSLDEPYRSNHATKSASTSGAEEPVQSTTEAELLQGLADRQLGKDGSGLLFRHSSDPLETHSTGSGNVSHKIVAPLSHEPDIPSIPGQQAAFTVTRFGHQLAASRLSNFANSLRPLVASTSNLGVLHDWADFELPPMRPSTAESGRGGRKLMEPHRIYKGGDFSLVPAG